MSDRIRDACVIIVVDLKKGGFKIVNVCEYEALKAAIKALFEQLTYEEQEQIIELIKQKRAKE